MQKKKKQKGKTPSSTKLVADAKMGPPPTPMTLLDPVTASQKGLLPCRSSRQ